MRAARSRFILIVGSAVVTTFALACDDDPSGSIVPFPPFSLAAVPDTLGTEEAIKVVFSDSISAATALDPANFVVTNLCTGLRIPGALRLGGDTLIFTPSQPFPFLTLLGIRIQNLLTPGGVSQSQPIAFQRITAPPPIRDQSWEFFDSPTNDLVTGVSFVTERVGYISELGGTIYRTTDGGQAFIPRFKDAAIATLNNVRAFGPDTVYVVGVRRVGNVTERSLFRSVDGGQSFGQAIIVPERLFILSMRRVNGQQEGVFAGVQTVSALYRFSAPATATRATGTPGSTVIVTGVDLSPNGLTALGSFRGVADPQVGMAFQSLDGGLSYAQLALPTYTFGLAGVGYASDTVAFILGDSSVVLRFNPTSASPTFTAVGAAAGIPQTEVSGAAGDITSYTFRRVQFAPDGSTGWMIGLFTRRRQGVPDLQGGIILQSDDRGLTWRRQAIQGASENGLSFPIVLDLQALRNDFAALSGLSGLVAARVGSSQSGTVCSIPATP